MIRQEIANLIKDSIKELQKEKVFPKFKIPEIQIEHSEEKIHGDYSTNIAFQIAKEVKKKPVEIAKIIRLKLKDQKSKMFEKVEIAKPGFVNFFLSKEYLQKELLEILKSGEKFGELNLGKGKKIQVEFISANPTGPLTVGNARGGPLGDVLGNILKRAGFKVEKAYYINDYGMQVLTLGHSVLKDSEAKYKGKYIDYLNKKIKEKDPYKAGERAAQVIVKEMIKKTTDRIGIKYDEWISETSLHRSGAVDQALELLKKEGLICQKEGALWFKSSKFGDERDRVVVKKDDWKTYLAGDIALHRYKFEKKKFDKVIDIWGADHAGDVAGLQAGVQALGHKGKLDIILLQFVTIFEKGEKLKMSKRAGIYVAMDELLDKVGSDVTRFFFLQKSTNTHLNFNLSLAREQSEKNPVYYVQYAHARICSIFKKAKIKSKKVKNLELLTHPSELTLIKQLIRFPEIIEDTTKDYQVQRIPQYAIDLATAFHQFYRDCKVLSEVKGLREARLGLILATKTVIKNTLNLMGISAPERM
ncbi:arginine--tRNA ligase [Patescibacteria group bacterium]|nr:arginine--tRNA ligase [Patescibacteria group bacterium]